MWRRGEVEREREVVCVCLYLTFVFQHFAPVTAVCLSVCHAHTHTNTLSLCRSHMRTHILTSILNSRVQFSIEGLGSVKSNGEDAVNKKKIETNPKQPVSKRVDMSSTRGCVVVVVGGETGLRKVRAAQPGVWWLLFINERSQQHPNPGPKACLQQRSKQVPRKQKSPAQASAS